MLPTKFQTMMEYERSLYQMQFMVWASTISFLVMVFLGIKNYTYKRIRLLTIISVSFIAIHKTRFKTRGLIVTFQVCVFLCYFGGSSYTLEAVELLVKEFFQGSAVVTPITAAKQ